MVVKVDSNTEADLSRYSLVAVRKWIEGTKLQAKGDLKTACENYSKAYQLSNAVYRVARGELGPLELKAIGESFGVK